MNIKLNINHNRKTVRSLNIPVDTHGQVVHVSTQNNVTYQFIDNNTHLAPQDMVTKRKGMKADPDNDHDLNQIHYKAYFDPIEHSHVFVQEGLIA